MIKAINILLLSCLFLSCTKDKVPPPKVLDSNLSFLLGSWKWESSTITINFMWTYGGDYEEFKSSETDKELHLEFSEYAILRVNEDNVVTEYSLDKFDHVQVENTHYIKFATKTKVLNFVYNEDLKMLTTVDTFLNLEKHPCNLNHKIINSVFKKE